MRLAALVFLLAACGDGLAPDAPTSTMVCTADVWETENTVSAVAAFSCDGDVPPMEAWVVLMLNGIEVGWRPHISGCGEVIIDTYDRAEVGGGTRATAEAWSREAPLCSASVLTSGQHR